MNKKISKSLTIALLLAINFSNSYATNNMNLNNNNMEQNQYSMDDIIAQLRQDNISQIDFQRMLMNVANRIKPMIISMQLALNANVPHPRIRFVGNQNNPQINVNIIFDFPDNNNSDAENVLHNANNMNINDIITELRSGNVSKDRYGEILNIIGDLISPMIQQMQLALMADNQIVKFQFHKGPLIGVNIIFDFPDNNNFDAENINYILNNLNKKNDVDTNVKQFFDNYIGNNYNLIFSNIFKINNDPYLNNIKSILQNNDVMNYLTTGTIKQKLAYDIKESHKQFFKSFNDPSQNDKPASKEEFKTEYKNTMHGIIQISKSQINNIRFYINHINSNNNQIKQVIKEILTQCVNNREQYLNNILQTITSNNHINNVYQDYLEYYANNNENNNENIINKHMPVL